MANTILHKRSSSSGSTPTAGQLAAGELALNTADGKVFMKNSAGTVIEVSYRDDRVDSRIQTQLSTLGYDIIPAADNTYSLGSASYMWKDVYIGPGSLYVNGQKVIEETSGNIVISCDINQNLVFQTSGSGDVELNPQGSGSIALKGPVQIQAGNNISSSDGNAIHYTNTIAVDSLTSHTSNTDLTLTGAGSGKVYVNDNAEVSGNLVVGGNLTISGTTTTVNSETISLADNIIDLNSNFTSGSPTENAGLRILRGDESSVQIRWNESSDVWQFTNDGSTYTSITGADATQTLTNKTINLSSNTLTGSLAQFNTALNDADFASLAGAETLTNKTIAAGSNTISGLTNSNLSGSAGITNANLANSSVTVGSTSISLGGTSTSLAGLTSVTSTSFTGALTGNASTASAWANARTITLGGDLSGSVSVDGSANVTLTATVAANSVALGTDTTGNYMTDVAAGTGISVSHTAGEGSTATITNTDLGSSQNIFKNVAVSGQTTVVADSNNDTLTFAAGTNVTITTDATTDTITISANDTSVDWSEIQNKPDPVITVTLTGDVTGTANTTLTDLASGTVSVATTIAADSVALGTDTTGNYMVNVTGSNGVSVSHTQGEGSTAALSLAGTYTGTWAVTGAITATGEVTAYASDARLKTEVVEIQNPLSKIEAIRGVTYEWNELGQSLGLGSAPQVGVIAQEIEAVLPQLVVESAHEGYKTVKYDKLTALLIEAVKELSAKVKDLEGKLSQ